MHQFDTPSPVRLRIELQAGDISIEATETSTTTVRLVPGPGDAAEQLVDETTVEQRGDEVVVLAPRRSSTFFRRTPTMEVVVTVPLSSSADVRLQSGDVITRGPLASGKVRTGSGDVRLDLVSEQLDVATGSGDVQVGSSGHTQLATGSGDVQVRTLTDDAAISTGSGDVQVNDAQGRLTVKTGSGDVQVSEAGTDVSIASGSGSAHVGRAQSGRVNCQTASGDVRVGIADGLAAWLDVHSLTGSVRSALGESAPPTDGEQTIEVRANTVSGDIELVRA